MTRSRLGIRWPNLHCALRHAVSICMGVLFLSGVAFANTSSDKPIYLYGSALTGEYLKANGSSDITVLSNWRKFLRRASRGFADIGRAELLGKLKPGLLILASSELLDDEERKAIQNFAASGGSLLATGLTGTRGGKGELKGHDFVNGLFGMRVKGEFSRANNEDWFMMPFGDGPLTWAVPAQRRIFMGDAKENKNMLRIEATNLAAVVMNWDREKDLLGANGVIAFNETEKYRGVFFGFPESAWNYSKPFEMLRIIDGTISWLQREPRLVKSAWPNANIAAHLMEMDTEDKYDSAVNFAADIESLGTKTTFYSTTSEAAKFPELVKQLIARGHEMAYHADVHLGLEGLKPEKQEVRIKNMIAEMTTLAGPDTPRIVTGFRAPLESYDKNTEILLRKYGIKHHAADPSSSENRLPFFSSAEPELSFEDALVVLPRTQLDDIVYWTLDYTPADTLETLKHDLDLVVKGGAFGLFSVHTQNYYADRLLPKVMPDYMKYVATFKDRVWIPRADEIASWWRQRERVKVTHLKPLKQTQNEEKKQGISDIVLEISVAAPGNVDGLTVFAMNPKSGVMPSVQARNAGAPKVRVKLVDAFRSALVFDKLTTGNFEYVIRYPLSLTSGPLPFSLGSFPWLSRP